MAARCETSRFFLPLFNRSIFYLTNLFKSIYEVFYIGYFIANFV